MTSKYFLPTLGFLISAALLTGCVESPDDDFLISNPSLPESSVTKNKKNVEEESNSNRPQTPIADDGSEGTSQNGLEQEEESSPIDTAPTESTEPVELIEPAPVPTPLPGTETTSPENDNSAPEPQPEPAPEPQPEPAPEPQPEPAPEPQPEPEVTPANIESHITAAAYTELAEEIYLSTSPAILDADSLAVECAGANSTDPNVNTLGCYVFPPGSIFVYDVTDARVSDAEIVTAAHEMLHAVWYQDMTRSERANIGNALRTWFDDLPGDHWLRDRLAPYFADRPESIPTELHSILGTEASGLPEEIESHYSKYFSNRAVVVGLADGVHGYIRELGLEIDELEIQISETQPAIESRNNELSTLNEQLNNDVEEFNAAVEAGEYDGQYSEYEEARSILNDRAEALQSDYAELSNDIASYNQIVSEYNEKASEINSLNASLTP